MRAYLNGNEAVATAVRLARTEVVAAYPITPQSTIVEKIAEYIADGSMAADYIRVESEHAALAACYGAAVTGTRVFTATSSQGLAYMYEMLHYVSGCRIPLVMAVANRGLAAPWTIWADHQDAIACRDTGWIQLYVETAQEALDTCLQAYKIAAHAEVLTPVMVCLDGYVLSHTEEIVDVPDQETVDRFLPPYQAVAAVDPERPYVFGVGAGPELYPAFKYYQQQAMLRAQEVIKDVDREFGALLDRSYGGLVDPYFCDDADVILVLMGSTAGTAREVVDDLRRQGERVGLLRLRSFRPFPVADLRATLAGAGMVAVLDRDCSFGYEGVLATEVRAALYDLAMTPGVPVSGTKGEGRLEQTGTVGTISSPGGPVNPAGRPGQVRWGGLAGEQVGAAAVAGRPGYPLVTGFVGGLGGRDISPEYLTSIFRRCLEALRRRERGSGPVVTGGWQK